VKGPNHTARGSHEALQFSLYTSQADLILITERGQARRRGLNEFKGRTKTLSLAVAGWCSSIYGSKEIKMNTTLEV